MEEDEPGLVRDAQAGDHAALQELLARYVPLLHNLVGRSVSRPADAEVVTLEAIARVVEEPPTRSGLVDVAVPLIDEHFRRLGAGPTAPLPGTDDQGHELQGEQRDLVRAVRWLDVENRVPLVLWWEECAGRITRSDVARTLDLSGANTAVRLQRMREQLESCRLVVGALGRIPLCAGLSVVTEGWDGEPDALWRMRIGEHVRACVVCLRESQDESPAARLFAEIGPLPVPPSLIATLVDENLLVEEASDEDDLFPSSSTHFNKDGGTWGTVRWAGRIVGVTTAATLLLFAGGFVYDVSQTPAVRQETRNSATSLSATLAKAQGCSGEATYTVKNSTVIDEETCLVWERQVAAKRYTYEAAQNHCAELTLGDGTWRLPTRTELASLLEAGSTRPDIDTEAFPDTPATLFWTSSPWLVSFSPGQTGNAADRAGKYAVRCVLD